MYQSADINIQSSHNYPVYVGQQILAPLREQLQERFGTDRIALVIDENVARLHGERLNSTLLSDYDPIIRYTVPAGEQSKSFDQWKKICDHLLDQQVRRSTPLLAIGGGVTGDLAGFVASTVLRGIPLVHIPTTLLAMVDSSVGGKTGINHLTGKNLIGSFYQPVFVGEDISFLNTLEYCEWVNGLSEILKYGAIADQKILERCAHLTTDNPFQDPGEWLELIKKSVAIKAEIVEKDTRESGVRAHLNFGHTFGHALEGLTEYGRFSHGEAVFLGMHAALFASKKLGADIDPSKLCVFNQLYEIDIEGLPDQIDSLIERMYYDKKVRRNTIRLVLLQEWEHAYVTDCEDHELLRDAWQYALQQFS